MISVDSSEKVNGATLSTGSYNPATNKGGLIAFKARSVSICSNCKIDASGRGHSGGLDIWTRTGVGSRPLHTELIAAVSTLRMFVGRAASDLVVESEVEVEVVHFMAAAVR